MTEPTDIGTRTLGTVAPLTVSTLGLGCMGMSEFYGTGDENLLTRDLEDEILPTIRELGIGLVPYSPLGRGLLTGAVTSEDSLEHGDSRRTAYFPRFQGESLDANLVLVDKIRQLASAKGCSPGQLALAWVLAQGDDIVPIPGTKRVRYLEENAAAAGVRLNADDLAELTTAVPRDAVAGDRYGDMSSIDQ